MPLIIEGGRVPTRWAEKKRSRRAWLRSTGISNPRECVSLALINNMPDAALEDTELQFFESFGYRVRGCSGTVKLYSSDWCSAN